MMFLQHISPWGVAFGLLLFISIFAIFAGWAWIEENWLDPDEKGGEK